MDSSISPKDEIWFLRVRHHISNADYYSLLKRMQLTYTTWVVWYWSKTREVAFPQNKPQLRSTENFTVSNSTFKQAAITFFQILTHSKFNVFLQYQSMLGNLCVWYRATERRQHLVNSEKYNGCFHYEHQLLYIMERNNRCLSREVHVTHRHALWAKLEVT